MSKYMTQINGLRKYGFKQNDILLNRWNCLRPISLARPLTPKTKDKFLSELSKINSLFSNATFVIPNTLDTLNLQMKYPDESFQLLWNKAVDNAKEHEEFYLPLIKQLSIPWNLKKWNDYYQQKPDEMLEFIWDVYRHEMLQDRFDDFRKEFNKDVNKYLGRKNIKNEHNEYLVKEYISWELTWLFAQQKYNFLLYDSKHLKSWMRLHEDIVSTYSEEPILVPIKMHTKKK